MNDRIRELVKQSGLDYDELWTKDQLAVEKFAELIIADCIDQVEVFNTRMDAGPRHIVEAIKQHFGVKE